MNIPHEVISIFPGNPSKEIVQLFISDAAYFKAEKRGFESGYEKQDWLEAEREIKSCLNSYFDVTIHSIYN